MNGSLLFDRLETISLNLKFVCSVEVLLAYVIIHDILWIIFFFYSLLPFLLAYRNWIAHTENFPHFSILIRLHTVQIEVELVAIVVFSCCLHVCQVLAIWSIVGDPTTALIAPLAMFRCRKFCWSDRLTVFWTVALFLAISLMTRELPTIMTGH
jgi:hypothetical protein